MSRVLVPLSAFLLLSACTSPPPTVTPAPADTSAELPTPNPEAETLTVEVTNSELAVGEERIALRLYDSSGAELTDAEHELEVSVLRVDPATGSALPVATGASLYFGIPVADGKAWIVYNEFDASGPWAIQADAKRPDGWTGTGRVDIEVAGKPVAPRVGEFPPFDDTPASPDGSDLEQLTSDSDPEPQLYEMSIADATTSGKPTVVHFGSPGHCDTEICRATLDEVKAVMRLYGEQVNFIHVETRDLTDPTRLSEANTAWSLPSEPWTFLIGPGGRITTRVEGPLDRSELELLIRRTIEG